MGFDSSVLQQGNIFGRDFRVIRALKSGGMGAVYIVEQLSTGKRRALKVMNPELAQDQATRERFVLEARAASQIDSDHVVEVVTAGVDDDTGALFLVMELLRGEELEDAQDRLGPLPVGDVADVLLQVGHALERAHAMGIVHRDLKPQNIFLAASRRNDSSFTAKILDFGIAKLVADQNNNQKTSTQALGSPLFMSPEQTDARGRITPATDVWALGLITFRLLTGENFWRETQSLPALMREIVLEPIPFASERARELGMADALPVGFDAWFARCVHRDSAARFPEAGACVRAFAELVQPGAPRGKLTVNVEMAQTSPSYVAGMPAAALVGSAAQHRPLATGVSGPPVITGPPGIPIGSGSGAPIVTGPPVSAEQMADLATSKTASVTGNPASAPTTASSAGPNRLLLLAVPALLGAAVAGFALLRGGPPAGASGSMAASGTPIVSAAPSASAPASAASPELQCPPSMVSIPGGPMFMGARDLASHADAKPPHRVVVSAFCLDRTEVTVADYQTCVDSGKCERALDHVSWPDIKEGHKKKYSDFCNAGKPDKGKHPINCVAWAMADNYCRQSGYRLPTEAEWEFAARGSSQRKYPWGDDAPSAKYLNSCDAKCAEWKRAQKDPDKTMFEGDDGYLGTAPVGSFPAGDSAHGVHDLAGNVWEWTADWYEPYSETDSNNPPVDPKGAKTGEKRVLRGGDYLGFEPDWSRPSYRWKTIPDTYNHAIGFRCAKSP